MKFKSKAQILLIFAIFFSNSVLPASSLEIVVDTLSIEKSSVILPYMQTINGSDYAQIASGPTGNVHLIFQETSFGITSLKYTSKGDIDWSTPQLITENANDQWIFDFTVDSRDKIHLSFGDSSGNITYFSNSGDGWTNFSILSNNNETLSSDVEMGLNNYFNLASSTEYSWEKKSLTLAYRFPTSNLTVVNTTTYINSTLFINSTETNDSNYTPSTIINVSSFETTMLEENPSMTIDSNGTAHIVYEGLWNNPSFPDAPVWDIFYTTFQKITTPYEFTSFINDTSIINSTTNETLSILTNTTTRISNQTGWFSAPVRLSISNSSLDFRAPQIVLGSRDQLHVSWIQSVNNSDYQLQLGYMFTNSTGWTSENFSSPISLVDDSYSMKFDSSNTGYFLFKNLETLNLNESLHRLNMTYFSNNSGSWKYTQLVEPLYEISNFHLFLDPAEKIPRIFIQSQATEDSLQYSYVLNNNDGHFGDNLGYSALLSGKLVQVQSKNDNFDVPFGLINSKFLESNSYIEVFNNRLMTLNLTFTNLKPYAQSPDLDIVLVNNSQLQLAENENFTKHLSSLASHSDDSFYWNFELTQGDYSIIDFVLERDGIILYRLQFIVIVKESFSFTLNLAIFAGLLTVFSLGYWYLRRKK